MKLKQVVQTIFILFHLYLLPNISLQSVLFSQTTITIGSGTSTQNENPFNASYNYSWSAVIYKKDEINTAGWNSPGLITKIAYYAELPGNFTAINQRVYMTTTALTSFPDGSYPDPNLMVLVYNGSLNWTTSGWQEITLTTPFPYMNDQNLIIYWQNWDGSWVSNYPQFRYTTTEEYMVKYARADANFPNYAGTQSYLRANIQLTFITGGNMSFVSSTTTQPVITPCLIPSTNQLVIGIQIVTSGLQSPLNVTQFNFNTNGTTNVNDIENARLYYTGLVNYFSTSNQFGTTITNPSGNFSISGTQNLSSGTNYFWLTYDIKPGATSGNYIDAECTQITISGANKIPSITTPSGNRTLRAPLIGTFTVGIGGNYTNLNQAFQEIRYIALAGNVTLNIISDIVEPNSAVLDQWNEVGAGNYTLTIKPSGSARTIQGDCDSAVIVINGADRVTIDGRLATSQKALGVNENALTIINTSMRVRTAVIWIKSLGTDLGARNVTIRNCILLAGSNFGRSSVYGIYAASTTSIQEYYNYSSNGGLDNDSLVIIENIIKKCAFGIYAIGSSSNLLEYLIINGNVIGSDVSSEYVSTRGIFHYYGQAPAVTMNTIYNMIREVSSTWGVVGIEMAYVPNSSITRNKIFNLNNLSTSGYQAVGISLGGSTTQYCLVANNVIYNILTNGAGTNLSYYPVGIWLYGGTKYKVYYNSVALYGYYTDTTKNTVSAAFMCTYGSGNVQDTVKNNIFSNTIEGGAGAKSYSVYVGGTMQIGTTNFNNMYVGGRNGVLGFYQSLDRTSLSAWQTATGQDANSNDSIPRFNRNDDLRLRPNSYQLARGTPITEVTNDYLNAVRHPTTPTIGAYENSTNTGPQITYTPLTNIYNTGNNSLNNVSIVDEDGIAGGGNAPRIYWRKNQGAWNSSAGSPTSRVSYNFTIGTTGLVVGDTIYYFVIAQDNFGAVDAEPNAGLIATSVNNITSYPTNPNKYVIIANPNYGGGGAGSGGYFFANSTSGSGSAPSQPTYSWIDPILNNHTKITSWTSSIVGDDGDDAYFVVPDIGFNFPFFGNNYRTNNLYITTNGYLYFGATAPNVNFLQDGSKTIPSASPNHNIIAGCMMDMNASNTLYPDVSVYYGGDANYFVVTYYKLHQHLSNTNYITFQIVLKSNGNIKIQYNETESTSPFPSTISNDAVIGIENSTGALGIGYRNDGIGGPILGSPLALAFGLWADSLRDNLSLARILISPDSLVIASNSTRQFNATGLSGLGSTVPINAQWSATGGTITSNGNYTAGTTYGNYTVTVKDSATNIQAIAKVYVVPNNVTLISPANNAVNQQRSILFNWYAYSDASSYRLYIALDSLFNNIFFVDTNITAATSKQIDTLRLGTTYYWKVVVKKSNDSLVSSETWKFTTAPLTTHNILLPTGWYFLSSYINPLNADLDSIFKSIVSNVVLMKNIFGNVYWPFYGVNTIGNWNYCHGYQIFMSSGDTLRVSGAELNPTTSPISLTNGWNLSAYLRKAAMRIDSAISSIVSKLTLAKNYQGKIYWPAFGINQIGSMMPGEAYQMFLTGDTTLIYPVNPVYLKPTEISEREWFANWNSTSHFKFSSQNTGNNATLLVLSNDSKDGDEVALYDSDNQIVGAGVFTNGKAVINILGDDILTKDIIEGARENENLKLIFWSKEKDVEWNVNYSHLEDLISTSSVSELIYKKDGIWIARISLENLLPNQFILYQNYPNPFNPTTTIKYGLPKNSKVLLEVFNTLGEKVMVLVDEEQTQGYHSVELNNKQLSSGIYFYRLSISEYNFIQIKKMIAIK